MEAFGFHGERAEASIASLFGFVWRRRKTLAFVILAGGLAGLIAAAVQTPKYVAAMEIIPNVEDKAGLASILDPSGNNLFSGLLSNSPFGKSDRVSPFQQFTLLLFSREVAARLEARGHYMEVIYPDKWDAVRHQWKDERPSLWRAIKSFLNLPVPQHPDDQVFADYLEGHISVTEDKLTAMVTLSYAFKDRRMAGALLNDLYYATEEAILVRQGNLEQARLLAAQRDLPEQALESNRSALIQVLTYYNLRAIETKAGSPYAAIKLSGPDVAAFPTDPDFLVYIFSAAFLALVSAITLMMIGAVRK